MAFGPTGSKIMTTTGTVTAVTVPTRLYALHVISGTAAVVILKNNGTGGTAYVQATGTLNTGATFTFGPLGFFFPQVLFYTADGNQTSVIFEHETEVA